MQYSFTSAVVAFAVGELEETPFRIGSLLHPQRAKHRRSFVVRNTGQTVLTPAVGTRARVIVREEVPGISVLAVVLTHRAPLAFAKVRPPLLPRDLLFAIFVQAGFVRGWS